MEGDPPWWGILVISAGVTAALGAIFLSVAAAVALGVIWVRGRRSR
ncbi:hypothetical protein [Streptomyces sp. JH34]|nr:hypothetical protein [Streptomyces sp. JH34]MDF6020013.1 hypothetical protein [Streptomyces sp. JH34]